MNKLPVFLLLLFLGSCFSLAAQEGESSEKNFHISIGVSLGSGTYPESKNNYMFSESALTTNLRYNFTTFSDDSAFGVDLSPAIGGFRNRELDVFLGFSLPVMLSYNYGLSSTYYSNKGAGFAIKTGLEVAAGPFIGDLASEYRMLIVYPAVQLNFRYMTGWFMNTQDLSFKFGYIKQENNELKSAGHLSAKVFLFH